MMQNGRLFVHLCIEHIVLLHEMFCFVSTECLKDLSLMILTQLVPRSSLLAEEDGTDYFLYKSHFKAFIVLLRSVLGLTRY